MTLISFRQLIHMIELNSQYTVAAMSFLSGQSGEWKVMIQLLARQTIGPFSPVEMKAHFIRSCKNLLAASQALGLKASEAAANRAVKESLELLAHPYLDAHILGRLVSLADHLVQTFGDEIEGRSFFVMPAAHSKYFSSDQAFGADVEDAFPSASFDISEAAKCRAFGRWTASVMHLMRVMEVGLSSLAKHYDVVHDANWNQVINQIEARTREVGKRSHGAEAEQWAAEAATHLRFVKNAWRNHAMHPLEKYDEDRAVLIFENCRSFMQHLAGKLAEFD
ncbi:hypothetical protein [Paracoccus cavernae]|uniref:hypothetical protein n=1 Tax=Paracoccus cavernae TaxID=1571207 RepID=UPI00363911E3